MTVTSTTGGTITVPASSPIVVGHGVATTITAVVTSGYTFTGWTVVSGSGVSIANPSVLSTTVTLTSGNAVVRANFILNTYQLTVTSTAGGAITAPSTSPATVNHGVATVITVNASVGYTFTGWTILSGTASIANLSALSTTATLTSGNATVRANFVINNYTLTIDIRGNGSVTKYPEQPTYPYGTQVELKAKPSLLNWVFSLWGGDARGTDDSITVTMNSDKTINATFVDELAYQVMYRSFRAESLAMDKDNKGKINKYVNPSKPVRSDFTAKLGVDSMNVNSLYIEFGSGIEKTFPFYTVPPSTITATPSNTRFARWNLFFPTALNLGDSVEVHGFGNQGKVQNVTKYYWGRGATMFTTKAKKDPLFVKNILCLPMPNRVNAMYETFYKTRYGANGMIVGKIPNEDATFYVKFYGWFQTLQYDDVLKTLIVSATGQMHTRGSRGFGVFDGGTKAILNKQKKLSPTKFNNKLLADMIALKLNIVASDWNYTPSGFGDLVFVNPGTQFDGKTIDEIAQLGDSLMMGWLVDSTYARWDRPITVKLHKFVHDSVFTALDSVIAKINNAFEGPLDTLHFVDSLRFKGYRKLVDVPFLRANLSGISSRRLHLENIYTSQEPEGFVLYQNYPNPFNPTTTIQFDLPSEALVTLKIYNILGQEVATILDRQDMNEGTQEVQFNANEFSSGVYFYRIVAEGLDEDGATAGTFQTVKKMMLLK